MRRRPGQLHERGLAADAIHLEYGAQHAMRGGHCGHCQFGGHFVCRDGPVFAWPQVRELLGVGVLKWTNQASPYTSSHPVTVASWRFWNAGEDLLKLAGLVDIRHFLRPASPTRTQVDIAFVEGSVSTTDELTRIQRVRGCSRYLETPWRLRHRRRPAGAA